MDPQPSNLIDSLTLQEAKTSSAIENIVTTQDDLFRIDITMERKASGPAKEVALYRDAMRLGWRNLKENQDIISNRFLIEQFQLLKGSTLASEALEAPYFNQVRRKLFTYRPKYQTTSNVT